MGSPFVKGNQYGRDFRFRPGQSGNPSGRHGKPSVLKEIEKALVQEIEIALPGEKKKRRMSFVELIAKVIITKASQGKFEFAKLVLEHIDGKPKESVDVVVRNPQETAEDIHRFLTLADEVNGNGNGATSSAELCEHDLTESEVVPAPQSQGSPVIPEQPKAVQRRPGRKKKLQDGDSETARDPKGVD
ncbi:MAG TPA: DUF5681 domain-containing protein [Terrimicrobiaceae bacterium]|nr:DUF5681 domain-containing protein [Terrimicrobiaceae bacterium]